MKTKKLTRKQAEMLLHRLQEEEAARLRSKARIAYAMELEKRFFLRGAS